MIQEYKDHNFDTNQDLPGNLLWEELYAAMPKGTKVILTVRDSDEIWFNSLYKFREQEARRFALGDFYPAMFEIFHKAGFSGKYFKNWFYLESYVTNRYIILT